MNRFYKKALAVLALLGCVALTGCSLKDKLSGTSGPKSISRPAVESAEVQFTHPAAGDTIAVFDIEVDVRFTPDGKIRPLAINYDKTRTYGIDRVLAVRHGTSRFGVKGHCFTCLICGQKRNLWLEQGKWFVEAYCATSEGRAS